MSSATDDPACATARGALPDLAEPRTLVAVFASPVAGHLVHFARDLGYLTVLIDPDPARVTAAQGGSAEVVTAKVDPVMVDDGADVVVTDHDHPELGPVLRDVLATRARWVGVMGSPRHEPPHVDALARLGVSPAVIARVTRPIGLNIGSRTPPEIAIATLAGLIADRNNRPGGFSW